MARFGADLAALVDTLIPGDGEFPAASTVGTHGVVAIRLREVLGEGAVDTVRAGLGTSLADLDADGRVKAVAAFEVGSPELFALVRMTTYLAYYEQPDVIAAVRALGFDYNDAPQPRGYDLPPFDEAIDAPKHGRGSYVRTEDVRRVDLSALDFLKGASR